MRAISIKKYGRANKVLEEIDTEEPLCGPTSVLIEVDSFGLNFADVMARKGLYREAPKVPFIPGYEVVGRVKMVGPEVTRIKDGDYVLGFTKFGGYAEVVEAEEAGVITIDENIDHGVAVALATQYCTAMHAAYGMANLNKGDHVLIHAAAGGVGTALVQMALRRECVVYATVGSDEKLEFLKGIGVQYPINYRKKNFKKVIQKLRPDGLDVIFDPVGGSSFSRDKKILGYGGRIVCYGASERVDKKGFGLLKMVLSFGLLQPIKLLLNSQGVLGINMLRIAEEKPHILEKTLRNVKRLYLKGELEPVVGGRFSSDEIVDAHELLESRQSIGKVVVTWKKD